MSNKNIKPDELAATINEFLTMATEEYTEVMKDVIELSIIHHFTRVCQVNCVSFFLKIFERGDFYSLSR